MDNENNNNNNNNNNKQNESVTPKSQFVKDIINGTSRIYDITRRPILTRNSGLDAVIIARCSKGNEAFSHVITLEELRAINEYEQERMTRTKEIQENALENGETNNAALLTDIGFGKITAALDERTNYYNLFRQTLRDYSILNPNWFRRVEEKPYAIIAALAAGALGATFTILFNLENISIIPPAVPFFFIITGFMVAGALAFLNLQEARSVAPTRSDDHSLAKDNAILALSWATFPIMALMTAAECISARPFDDIKAMSEVPDLSINSITALKEERGKFVADEVQLRQGIKHDEVTQELVAGKSPDKVQR